MRAKSEKANSFYYKRDRLNQLRGFCAVVQNDCSLIKASEKLGLEKPAISKQISALERDLGIELFNRKGKILKLNENGKSFYELSQPSLEQIDGIFKSFTKALEYERKNVLNIAALDAIITKLIPFLAEMKKKNPNLKITTFSVAKEKAFEMLIDKKLDIIIYPANINEEIPLELERKEIIKYKEYWILYKGHPYENLKDEEITKDMIAKYPFAVLQDLIYIKSFDNFIREYNIKTPIGLRYGTPDMVKEMVKTKICISLLDGIYINNNDKKELVCKNTSKNFTPMHYYYFINKNSKLKEITNLFLDIVVKNAEKIFG